MKLPCEMIRDLLPLYHDGICSEVSRGHIEEHLTECEPCRKLLDGIREEIEVPALEIDTAKPLVSIQVNWAKRSRREKWKYTACGIGAFFLTITLWWGLTRWCIVPLKAEDYIIKEAAQLENGVIHIEYSLMYEIAYPHEGVTEDGVLYDYRKRPVLAKRHKQIPNGTAGIFIEPDNLTWFEGEVFHAFCLGNPDSKESAMVWEVGMELPPASALTEEMYADLNSAYTAPNAPERPNHMTTVHVVKENCDIFGAHGD